MSGGLTFKMLGPLEVRRADGAAVDLGGPQSRLVLARLLTAERRAVAADAIMDILWGHTPPESAAGTLQTYVSRLRKAFGPGGSSVLRYESAGYLLDVAPDQLDARRFDELADCGNSLLAAGDAPAAARTLREAAALWRGNVLADMDAEFARTAAARWEERRLVALEDLYDAELQSGRAGAVAADLTAALGESPLRERLRGLLALALYRSGRQADALAVIDDGRRRLIEELGIDLSRELRDLRAQILDQDARLDLPIRASTPNRISAEDRPDEPAGPAPEPTGDLIGRGPELQALTAVLTETLRGAGSRCAVIEGEPGIGKTRLAQELARRAAAAGATVLLADTLESGAAPAYGPWLHLFRSAQQLTELSEVAQMLLAGTGQPPVGASPAVVAAALAAGVAETAVSIAGERGLVIVIEDLQWADPASLDLLCGLAPRIGTARVLIVVTVRELEVGRDDAVVDTLAQLTRQIGTRRISLRGLSQVESGELLARTAGNPLARDVVAAVHARSEGNPFFTTELARMIGEEGQLDAASLRASLVPTGVRDVVQRRVARLPEATGKLMEVAAVLGREVALDLLARVANRTLDECLDDLEPALLTRLLEVPRTAPGAVRFMHALVREAMAERMSPLRRARLHLRAADGILAAVGENDDTLEIIAEHLWHAAAVGASARAAAALEAAAQVALKRQALVSAESLLERAASLYRAAGAEGGLAELRVLRQLGFVGAALHGYAVNADSDLIRRARELARSTDRPDILLDLIWADWAGCDTGGQPWRGERLVQEAEALIKDLDDVLLHAAVASMRGFTERHFGRMTSAHDHIDRAVRGFQEAGQAQEAGFYLNGYLTSIGYRHWVRSLTHGLDRDALEHDYMSQHLPFGRMVISLFGAAATMAAADQEGLRLYAERMRAADPEMLLSFWSAAAELYTAVSLLQGGDLDAGLTLFAEGRLHMQQGGGRTMIAGLLAAAAQALVAAGSLEQARRILDEARTEFQETLELAYRPVVELAEAQLAAAVGDHARADELFGSAEAIALEHGSLALVARIVRERDAVTRSRRGR